ncbi:SWPV2-ORF191 [Shearwaterpox virus]|uniref:SWPV2-ORF191 n=1 Tax=Shearwaterpox virus TaxID=1974596 RepID=A0A1V0QGG5_CNPV|nr:SWPV2-ORF191 [Shearwaterpox virus]QRM15479.1 N1R/p28-like protein [Mudlarkpox virus]QRM15834.1 n1r/p28-like protein [Penguinpox virus 2]QRM16169.1 n1r/p28-like protein [Albatrosspox virus]
MDFRHKRCISDFFSIVRYGNVEVTILNSNNYVNVSQLCSYSNKDFTKWMSSNIFTELINNLEKNKSVDGNKAIMLIDGYDNGINGYYAHPSLVPIIASWASPTFAINASKIINYFMANNYMFVINDSTNCYMEMMNELNERRLREVRELKNHYREQKKELSYQIRLLRSKISDLENKNSNMRTKINNFNTTSKGIKDENNSVKNKIKITERLYSETVKENNKLNSTLVDLEKINEDLKNEMIELRKKVAKETTELYEYNMRSANNNTIESDSQYLMDRYFKRSGITRDMKKHYLLIMNEKANLLSFRYTHMHVRKVCIELYRSKDRYLLFYTYYEVSPSILRKFKEFLENNDKLEVNGCNFRIVENTYTLLDLRKDINSLLS